MLTVEGKYKDGKVILSEPHPEFDDSRVIVMFVEPRVIHLADKGIDRGHAANLRGRPQIKTTKKDKSEKKEDVTTDQEDEEELI